MVNDYSIVQKSDRYRFIDKYFFTELYPNRLGEILIRNFKTRSKNI